MTTKKTRGRLEIGRQERFALFRERFRRFFPCELPENIGEAQFLTFDSNWTPSLLETNRPSILANVSQLDRNTKMNINFQHTLRPFVTRLHSKRQRADQA